jgi:hypothetical protein
VDDAIAQLQALIGVHELVGEALNWPGEPNYSTLRLGLDNAYSAGEAATVEARRRVRLNEGRYERGRAQRAEAPKDPGHLRPCRCLPSA